MTTQTAPLRPVLDRKRAADPTVGAQLADRPHRPWSGSVLRALRWAVLALAVAMLGRFVSSGWPEIRASLGLLTAERLPIVGLAVVAETLWVYAMSQVYRSALRAFGGSASRRSALRISMAAFTLSRILPGGGAAGGAVAARELIALGNPAVATVISMLASWWITMAGLASVSFVGIAAAVLDGVLPVRYLVVPTIALVAFVLGGAGIAVATRHPRSRRRISGIIARGAGRLGLPIAAAIGDDALGVATGHVRRRGLLLVFGWGLAVWITDATAMWLALSAFGWHVDVGVLLVAYGVANLISALPELTPGWLGVLEASVAVTLTAFGVPEGIAAVSVLVYRLVSYWLPTAAGIPAATSVFGSPTPGPPGTAAAEGAGLTGARPTTNASHRTNGGPTMSANVKTAQFPPHSGPVALLGGDEHRRGSEAIERTLLDQLGVAAPTVAVVPVASAPRQVGMVASLARNYWAGLGTTVRIALPDDHGSRQALDAVDAADVIVLPGGVPNRLVAALGASPVWERILDRWRAGAALSGSSAGAMSLFAWRLRLFPPHPFDLVPGLGPFDGWIAAPHFSRFRAERWAATVARRFGGVGVLGLDESTAIVGRSGAFTVVGRGALTIVDGAAVTVHRRGAAIDLDIGGRATPADPTVLRPPAALVAA